MLEICTQNMHMLELENIPTYPASYVFKACFSVIPPPHQHQPALLLLIQQVHLSSPPHLTCERGGKFEALGGTNDLDDGAPKELIILILEAADAAAFDLSSSARCCGCYYRQDKLHLGYFSLN